MTQPNPSVHETVFDRCKGATTWTLVEFVNNGSFSNFNNSYFESIEFCRTNCRGQWFKLLRNFWFEDSADAILFKLRYG